MRDMWRKENGSARYVRTFWDMGIVPEHEYRDPETVEVRVRPEGYVSHFQYRRA